MQDRERMRIRGDNRGWQVKRSGGIPVWQLISGGSYQEFVGR